MRASFSLAFLLVGMPILFILREYIPIDKKVFTYTFVGIILLILVNYKNLRSTKFYFNIPLFFKLTLILIVTLFFISSYFIYGFNDQTIYLIIIAFIIFALFTLRGDELENFYKYVLILSSIAVYLSFLTTPLDISYWIDKGGRLYLGDTENPGLVSVLTAINLICILYYLASKTKKFIVTITLIPLLVISPYLYFLSQGKSTIIGLAMVLGYLLVVSFSQVKYNIKKILKFFFFIIVVITIFFNYLEKYISNFINIIYAAMLSLFGFKSEIIQRSAEIRNENFQKTMDYMSLDNFFGHGINTFRMDSPFLQTAVDFGNILAILFFTTAVIYPMFLIFKVNYKILDINTKLGILLYIFYFQNFFFHGTPYEYAIWLPFLIFLKLISSKKYRICTK